jgi:RNA polymerase sigma-70 factor (ECF subfamily)
MPARIFNSCADSDLLKGIKEGNMCSFDLLYNKYSNKVFRFAQSMLKSVEESENVVQDVFMTVWLNRDRIEKDASIKSYLFTITYNSSITILRRKVRDAKFREYLELLPSFHDAVNYDVEYRDLENKLNQILDELPSRQKEVYKLHRIEGLKYKDISERLHISVNTIENHMSSALKTIRKRLGALP